METLGTYQDQQNSTSYHIDIHHHAFETKSMFMYSYMGWGHSFLRA